jgi:peptide deformylase
VVYVTERFSEQKHREGNMTILNIVEYPNEMLSTKATDLTSGDILSSKIQTLIEDMIDTCHHHNGLGLAACQVGSDANVCIYKEKGFNVMINPRIVARIGKITNRDECCMSIPGQSFTLKRARQVVVKGLDRDGKEFMMRTARKRTSKIIQHEVDHLHGVTIVDKGRRNI